MCFIYLFILRIPFCLNWADWAEVAVTSVSVSATAEFPLGLELSKQKTPEPVTSCQEVARPTNSTTPGVSSHRDLSLYLRGRAGPNDVQRVHVCVRVRALAKKYWRQPEHLSHKAKAALFEASLDLGQVCRRYPDS